MTRLWIVRHGNTFAPGEPPRRVGSRTDPPLVASGVAQGRALARRFAEAAVRFDRVLAGPLRRAQEMARLVAGPAATIETAEWLNEIDHGPDENRPEEEVRARLGEQALTAWDRDGVAPPGWIVSTAAREAAWREAMAAAAGDWLLVTSNGAARFALFAAGLRNGAGPKLRTGAWGLLAQTGGTWQVVEWDRRP